MIDIKENGVTNSEEVIETEPGVRSSLFVVRRLEVRRLDNANFELLLETLINN